MKFRIKEKRIGSVIEISKVISSMFKEYGLDDEYIVQLLKRSWTEIVGEILSTHSSPIKLYGKMLLVYTDHSVFANDLSMIKEDIIQKIKVLYPGYSISDIKVDVNKKIKWS